VVRFALLLVVARLCLPLSSIVNDFVYKNFFKEQIEEASSNLSAGSAGLAKLKDFSLPNGIFGTASLLQQKSGDLRQALQEIGSNVGNLTENLLQLAFLYLGILVLQVLLLPLFVFFMLVKMLNALFDTDLPPLPLRSLA
jgi:predicted PurR-regulated permease PerM